jgi:hypothetical protein
MLAVGGAGRQVWGRSVFRSPGKQWSSRSGSAAPPPPPAAPPPRPGARRQLARSWSPRSRPREGDSRQPAHLLSAHWLPRASGLGGGDAAAAPSRAGKGAGDVAKSPAVGHHPARAPRTEPAPGGRLCLGRTVTGGGAVPKSGWAGCRQRGAGRRRAGTRDPEGFAAEQGTAWRTGWG